MVKYHKKRIHAILLSFIIFSHFSFMSCNETLPLREDITLQISVTASSGFIRLENVNYVRMYISVINNSDEMLDDATALHDTMNGTWISQSSDNVPNVNYTRAFTID